MFGKGSTFWQPRFTGLRTVWHAGQWHLIDPWSRRLRPIRRAKLGADLLAAGQRVLLDQRYRVWVVFGEDGQDGQLRRGASRVRRADRRGSFSWFGAVKAVAVKAVAVRAARGCRRALGWLGRRVIVLVLSAFLGLIGLQLVAGWGANAEPNISEERAGQGGTAGASGAAESQPRPTEGSASCAEPTGKPSSNVAQNEYDFGGVLVKVTTDQLGKPRADRQNKQLAAKCPAAR